jgi:hypothetical protein
MPPDLLISTLASNLLQTTYSREKEELLCKTPGAALFYELLVVGIGKA